MTEIRSDLAANIWKVNVTIGQSIEAGDVVAILESMKMEIPVEAPRAGIVAEVRVAPDDRVAEGDVIVVLT
jgi:biotin carboxyl carrier protein